jgi:hypothetical protein
MRIGEVIPAITPRPDAAADELAPQAATGRALVALAPPARAGAAAAIHRRAPFLAQLLAVRDRHAQTRERRRTEPRTAIAAYRAAAALVR